MASIRKHNNGWRAFIDRKGVKKSKVCATKREAEDWARETEHDIVNGKLINHSKKLSEAFDRYAREVSVRKRGKRWETIRLEKLQTYPIARIAIGEVKPSDVAAWRDARLQEVKGASVRREMQLMSSVFTIARKEWGWITASPMQDVSKPPSSRRRDRLVTEQELKALAISAGSDQENATSRAFSAFLFAIETGMRAGEIVGLEWGRVSLDRRVVHLPMTKNGEARDVPLSTRATEILRSQSESDPVFGLRSDNLDRLWRKLRDRAAVSDLRFHDSRHVAVTRLAKKLDVLDLARVIGHRDIKMLLVYYEADAESLSKLLD